MEAKRLKGYQNTTPETYGYGRVTSHKGRVYNLFDLDMNGVSIDDVARSLARQARYIGHTRQFYSIAQHCYMLAQSFLLIGEVAKAKQALMHDSGEAYMSDIPRPLKQLISDKIGPHEEELERRLAEKFGYKFPYDEDVMVADKNCAQYEMTVMMEHYIFTDYWDNEKAEKMFLEMWQTIGIMESYEVKDFAR